MGPTQQFLPLQTHMSGESWSGYLPTSLDPNQWSCFSTVELSCPPSSPLGESRAGTKEQLPEQRVRPPKLQSPGPLCVCTATRPGSIERVELSAHELCLLPDESGRGFPQDLREH